ncbi:hypothetical protein [Streptomyces sp. NBC_01244]|uniref:hypothetical protein n=1 Tax=Streptomyces sp. NBC_01244 TaxID=2903797 RepID=UPI002E10651A|nr:hypothetical protein OG247_04880 [Streptomyces sp. NBC_01244]
MLVGCRQRPLLAAGMDEKEELKRLRRENARPKEDNETLRKTAAYFARETTR